MDLAGVQVIFSKDIAELDPRIRGRLIYRITMEDDEEGELVFAGFLIRWLVHDFAGKRCLDISMGE